MKIKRIAVQWMGAMALAAMLSGGATWAQGTTPTVKDDLFAGTEKFSKGASDVTEVTMDPDTLDMVSGNNAKRAHNMVLNVVRTYEYDKPGMYNIADVEEFRRKLDTGDWHCSVHTRDLKNGESTDICSKHRTDGLIEQAIITVEPKELTFIHTIRRPGSGEKRGGPDAINSGFMIPDLAVPMSAIAPEMAARMAHLGPETPGPDGRHGTADGGQDGGPAAKDPGGHGQPARTDG